MRWWLVVALAGCGRLGFGPDAPAGDTAAGPDSARPPLAFGQHTGRQCTGGPVTCNAVFGTPSVAGDVVLMTATYASTTAQVKSVSDSDGDVFQLALGPMAWAGSPYRTELWWATANGGGSPSMVIVELTAASTAFEQLALDEYTGVDPTQPVDQIAFASGLTGTTFDSGPKTITHAPEIIFGHGEGMSETVSAGLGFTVRDTSNANIEEDQIVSTIGSYAATFGLSKSGEWIALMVTLR